MHNYCLCFQLPLPPRCSLLHQGTSVLLSRALQRGQVRQYPEFFHAIAPADPPSACIYSCMCILLFFRRFLRETLKMSNAEDLNRLTACSLVLLGHIFYVLGNHRVRLILTGHFWALNWVETETFIIFF